MPSLFNPTDTQDIINRIQKLSPDSKAQWGRMNVSQMLSHCTGPLNVATGALKLKQNWLGKLFGPMVKRKMLGAEPLGRNTPTAPEFVRRGAHEFEAEQQNLISLVQAFSKNGPAGLSKDPHPFFGKMAVEEWDVLNWKHLDHHLRQFGQ